MAKIPLHIFSMGKFVNFTEYRTYLRPEMTDEAKRKSFRLFYKIGFPGFYQCVKEKLHDFTDEELEKAFTHYYRDNSDIAVFKKRRIVARSVGTCLIVAIMAVFAYQQMTEQNIQATNPTASSSQSGFDFNGRAVNNSRTLTSMPGLLPVDVYMNFTNKGFTLTKRLSSGQCIYSCIKESSYNTLTVDVYGKTPTDVTAIEAAFGGSSTPGESASDFLGYVATMQYDNANPQRAREWVSNHVGTHAVATIGGVKFETFSKGSVRMLVMSVGD